MQREILDALAKQALDPMKPGEQDIQRAYDIQDAYKFDDAYELEDAILLEGGDATPAYWVDLYVILGIRTGDLARSSSARRAVRSLFERGLLEVSVLRASTGYVRAEEPFGTERWTTYVRLPPMRFDPEVAESKGSIIAEHCGGIADVLARPRQLAVQQWRNRYGPHEPEQQPRERHAAEARLAARYLAEVRLAERAVTYHLRQLDRLPPISPIGWPHVYTRHVAHWAYETERSSGVGP